ncbi:GntR family transcriptional regulator [Solitalea longa]|uniref:GntR family transcriptional regulator n=1 Tax=Solitalea longa TaxID=2079460 RepID=A0A2S5A735_9SPHI|nr:GntR family transcriptional regulator [Solitalea longa]POY38398.1 GntR family transcriptional regulator [Solitalea longa]
MQFREQQAIYLQIVDYACEQILRGIWLPEQRIPSVRELAITLEVNPNTIMRAYEILQDETICSNKRGVGFFTSLDTYEKVQLYKRKQFIENDLPPLFKNMHLLGISIRELEERYQNYTANLNVN